VRSNIDVSKALHPKNALVSIALTLGCKNTFCSETHKAKTQAGIVRNLEQSVSLTSTKEELLKACAPIDSRSVPQVIEFIEVPPKQ
jgi:hypothetical protein